MNEIFGLLGWSVDTQAKWCQANADLSVDEQVEKLKKELDKDDPPAGKQEQTQSATSEASKPGPVPVDSKPKPTGPKALDAQGWE